MVSGYFSAAMMMHLTLIDIRRDQFPRYWLTTIVLYRLATSLRQVNVTM